MLLKATRYKFDSLNPYCIERWLSVFAELKDECLLFFNRNPFAYVTLDDLARFLCRDAIDLDPVLKGLVSSGNISYLQSKSQIYYNPLF
jgi:hypothetical protein